MKRSSLALAAVLPAVLLAVAVALQGCAGDGSDLAGDMMPPPDGGNGNPNATLEWIQANVFGVICIHCHTPGGDGPMPLTSEEVSFQNLVGVPSVEVALDRVEPGDPEASYLVHKIEDRPTIVFSRMPPPPFAMLDDEQITAIIDWIAAGAAP